MPNFTTNICGNFLEICSTNSSIYRLGDDRNYSKLLKICERKRKMEQVSKFVYCLVVSRKIHESGLKNIGYILMKRDQAGNTNYKEPRPLIAVNNKS